jgi:ribosome-binding factor A
VKHGHSKARSDRRPSAGPSQRQLRVGEELRHALVEILPRAHFRDPELQGVSLTVTEVRASPDLKHATAFVTPLGGRGAEVVVKALNRAAAYLRGEVARMVQLRHAPELVFAADRSFDQASRIDAALRRPDVQRDLAAARDGDDGDAQG